MTKLIVDAATRAKLHDLGEPLEVCDESGQTLGYFHPMVLPTETSKAVPSAFSDEELRLRRQQRTGKPLAEILKQLGAS